MTNTEICAALFSAFASGDDEQARALCAPELVALQNGAAMDLDALLQMSRVVRAAVTNFRYEAAVRSATETGFVEEHAVRGTLPDGSELDLAACVVGEVRDGRVVALREYLDSAAAAGLLKALS